MDACVGACVCVFVCVWHGAFLLMLNGVCGVRWILVNAVCVYPLEGLAGYVCGGWRHLVCSRVMTLWGEVLSWVHASTATEDRGLENNGKYVWICVPIWIDGVLGPLWSWWHIDGFALIIDVFPLFICSLTKKACGGSAPTQATM